MSEEFFTAELMPRQPLRHSGHSAALIEVIEVAMSYLFVAWHASNPRAYNPGEFTSTEA
ncbi:hypothetical protein ACFC0D_13060 [Streptomyces sp. NPDC056222]|uniref:hypothetical protein n=1 Tax=Streptomyces sp. NPDC056222 TaxID=3345749 RepID=UPI0035DCA88E